MARVFVLLCALVLVSCASSAEALRGDWRLVHMEGGPNVFGERAPTLSFNEPGRAGGFAGCNQFFATVTHSGDAVTFSQIGATRMFCEQAMPIESAYLAALANVRNAREEEGRLLMFDAAGTETLRFER